MVATSSSSSAWVFLRFPSDSYRTQVSTIHVRSQLQPRTSCFFSHVSRSCSNLCICLSYSSALTSIVLSLRSSEQRQQPSSHRREDGHATHFSLSSRTCVSAVSSFVSAWSSRCCSDETSCSFCSSCCSTVFSLASDPSARSRAWSASLRSVARR